MSKKWTDALSDEILNRLCNCVSRKSDIGPLVNARWAWMKEQGKDKQGFIKEDALVDVLDLLDSNSNYFDLTEDEYSAVHGITDHPPRRPRGPRKL